VTYHYAHRSAEKSGISISGTIETTSIAAGFRIPGRLKERSVDEGMTVRKGAVIARLEEDDLHHEVELRSADLQAARAQLDELQSGSLKEEIARAEASVEAATAEEQRLKTDLGRQQALLAREVIPRRDFDAVQSAYDSAKARLREARETLKLVRKGPRIEKIDNARSRLKSSEAALNLAKDRLSYAVLTAPADGLITSKHAEPGEQLATGAPVVTISRMDSVWLKGYISESDLGKVKVGQKAEVTNDSYPGRKYQGTVSFIASEAEFTPKNIQTQKERVKLVYRIKIDIPNPKMELKPGMPADAHLPLP
jgi:HlyD family secretion protein